LTPSRVRSESALEKQIADIFCLMGLLLAGALSSYAPSSYSLMTAYAEEFNMELGAALRMAFNSTLLGVLPRS